MVQLHERFTVSQVKKLIYRYLGKEIERSYIEEILGIKRRRFYQLVKEYCKNPSSFPIEYKKKNAIRKISRAIEDSIMK